MIIDSHFRNVRLSLFNFITVEFSKTDYANNNIRFRGESNPKLYTDDVHCRLDQNDLCAVLRPEFRNVKSPNSLKCNVCTCPKWMPYMINYDEIDYQVKPNRILRIDFMSKEMVNSRYDMIQFGAWSNKGDDPYKHKLYLLRDILIKILNRDDDTGMEKSFGIINWDDPEGKPLVIDGNPRSEINVTIHLKEGVKRPIDDKGYFGEVFTIWLLSGTCQDRGGS